MTGSALKVLVGLLMLSAPASLGFATVSDSVTVPVLEDRAAEQGSDAEVVKTYEKEYETQLKTGELDLRIDRGSVRVIGWSNNSVKVKVLQTKTSDDRTEVQITDETEGSHLNLSVLVDRNRQHGISVDAGPVDQGEEPVDKAIIAYVPESVSYDKVHACEGEQWFLSKAYHDVADRVPGMDDEEDADVCVPADTRPEGHGTIQIGSSEDRKHLNVTWGAIGLHGKALEMRIDYGNADLEALDFQTIDLKTDYGNVDGLQLSAETLDVTSDYGDISLNGTFGTVNAVTDYGDLTIRGSVSKADVTTDYGQVTVSGQLSEGSFVSDYGDVTLQLTPQTSGQIEVTTDYGDVAVTVPDAQRYGYDVSAATDYGDIMIGLDDARSVSSDQGDEGGEEEHDDGEQAHVRTNGYQDRTVTIQMGITTDYGDVWVTDDTHDLNGTEGQDDDEETGGQGTGSSQQAGPADALAGARLG